MLEKKLEKNMPVAKMNSHKRRKEIMLNLRVIFDTIKF